MEAGTLASIEVTRAEAQVYVSQQDLLVSQTNLLQQETVLKNAISRNGIANSTLIDAHVIPLDTITIPARDETPPVNQLVEQALANRSEIAQSRLNIDSDKLNLVGIKNALKPTSAGLCRADQQWADGNAHADRASKLRALLIWPAATATCWARCSAGTFPTIPRVSR